MKDIVHQRCAGLDIHKDSIAACVRWADETGQIHKELRVFGTTTRELEMLAAWLKGHQIRLVAMESTGDSWKPIWNILEGPLRDPLLANSQHIRNIPTRKTDKKAASGSPSFCSTISFPRIN